MVRLFLGPCMMCGSSIASGCPFLIITSTSGQWCNREVEQEKIKTQIFAYKRKYMTLLYLKVTNIQLN